MQGTLTDSQDQFLQQLSILISHLNAVAAELRTENHDRRAILATLQRIETQLNNIDVRTMKFAEERLG